MEMNNTTLIVVLVVVVLIIGIIMYQSSQQAQRDRDLQLQLASMQNPNPETGANFWSSIGDWGGVINTIGGLFGGGGGSAGLPIPSQTESVAYGTPNIESMQYTSTGEAALNGYNTGVMYADMVDADSNINVL